MLMCTDRVRRRLEVVAATDPLTGLFNRRSFGDTAADRFNKAKVAGKGFMLVLLDVDRFKAVNDTYGHEVGDKVLMHVAGRLQNVARDDDMIARLGGEEFVMLLETDDWEGGMGAAERIRQAVADQAIRVDLQDIVVTVSGGVARFDPEDHSLSDVLRRADQALYLAKSAGRNRVAARA
ncbi:MAG: GGDEF domain-containing protein [Pigmentiphaga sp.]|nr:GGDEF domain-containing protein [Pigmentiphaga sp.]